MIWVFITTVRILDLMFITPLLILMSTGGLFADIGAVFNAALIQPGEVEPVPDQSGESLHQEISNLCKQYISGDLAVRLDPGQYQEEEQILGLVVDINQMLDSVGAQYSVLATTIEQMKTGWIPVSVGDIPPGPFQGMIKDLDDALSSASNDDCNGGIINNVSDAGVIYRHVV